MNILKQIDQISFKQLLGFSIIIALLAAVPITVWTTQQETETQSSAYFEKPDPIKKEYGSAPQDNPEISLVWPFVGKINDAVIIQGNNFGNNPKNKTLYLGNIQVKEEYIKDWQPKEIVFHIPPRSSFGPISINIEGKKDSWTLPFTVYKTTTSTQVTEKDGIVWVNNNPIPVDLSLFMQDGQKIDSDNPELGVTYPQDNQIISVQVTNKRGIPLPFYVEPSEFGF